MPYRIRELRKKKDMTQVELCKKADVSRQTLCDLESGKDANTTIVTLQKIANVLHCRVQDLICP